jgi:hypothetical protein
LFDRGLAASRPRGLAIGVVVPSSWVGSAEDVVLEPTLLG